MSGQAITFDFHNTLAACPEWFDLEVKHLPSSFLRWWPAAGGATVSDETLEEADALYRQLRREVMDHGIELTAEASLERVFSVMDLPIAESDIAAGIDGLMREALDGVSPMPGAVETVRAVHDAGITVGVVSSAVYHPFLEWTLDRFGLRPTIRTIVSSASAGFYKSRPEIYRIAAREIGADPLRMVHVGDSLRFDVGGASQVGMGTVWLQHREPTADERAFVPDLTLRSLHDAAPAILQTLANRVNGNAD